MVWGVAGGLRAFRRDAWAAAVAALALAGCGRWRFDPSAVMADAGGDDGDVIPTPPDAGCTFGPFGPPVNLTALNSNFDDWAPSLSGDGLRLVFDSNRPSGIDGYDLYEATRPDPASPFGAPALIAGLNGNGHQASPFLSADGLTLYFHDDASGTDRMFVTSRPTVDQPFGPAVLIEGLETQPGWGPKISDDGLELFFSWFTMNLDVYRATRASTTEPFSMIGRVTELNSAAADGFAYVLPDDLTLLMMSDRSGVSQLYTASRSSRGAPFSTPVLLDELVSTANTSNPMQSRDGATFMFSSQRPGGVGSYDLWMTTRECVAL